MWRKSFVFVSVLAVVIPVAWRAQRVVAQAPSSAAKANTVPRTADRRPDLQGVWNYATITPLERPKELAGKEVLTAEEAAKLEARVGQNAEVPRQPGNPGGYNAFWSDRGTKVIGTRRTSLIVDPPDGKLPSLTPKGQADAAARDLAATRNWGPEDRDVVERCLMGFNAGPPMLPSPYNNMVQIFQTSNQVVILNEMVHNARMVPMDGRPHGSLRRWAGDSRGRWEGDTLVVDTTNFTDKGTGLFVLQYQGDENAHVVERFTRLDANTLLYEFTLTDPTIWTKPFTGSFTMTKTTEKVYEYACHEGNYGMVDILAGARADEKAGRKPSCEATTGCKGSVRREDP
jgi:hypothetical protein